MRLPRRCERIPRAHCTQSVAQSLLKFRFIARTLSRSPDSSFVSSGALTSASNSQYALGSGRMVASMRTMPRRSFVPSPCTYMPMSRGGLFASCAFQRSPTADRHVREPLPPAHCGVAARRSVKRRAYKPLERGCTHLQAARGGLARLRDRNRELLVSDRDDAGWRPVPPRVRADEQRPRRLRWLGGVELR